MAKHRTPEEISAIVDRCIELEESGGDILGYLWTENYLTPRATWCNFQREWLGRKPYEYTDGKPKTRKEREMAQRRAHITDDQRAEAVRIAMDGGDPRKYIGGLGFADPQTTWMKIKTYYRQTAPDVYAQIPKRIGKTAQDQKIKTDVARKTAEKTPTLTFEEVKKSIMEIPQIKVDGPLRIETPEANQVQVVEVPEKAKINQPLMHSGKKAIGWEGDFGVYIYDRKHGYIDYESNDGEEISMPVDAWREWLKEIGEIAQLMGVEL